MGNSNHKGNYTSSTMRKDDQCGKEIELSLQPRTQRSSDVRMPDGNHLKQSKNWTSAPVITTLLKSLRTKTLFLEEKILLSLNVELESIMYNSFTTIGGAKRMKGIKIIGCGNEKTLTFLISFI